jgi:hypothetical protein
MMEKIEQGCITTSSSMICYPILFASKLPRGIGEVEIDSAGNHYRKIDRQRSIQELRKSM